jgi:threonyl-tRNA synthetase
MRKEMKDWKEFTHTEVSLEEGLLYYKDNPYKCELIREIAERAGVPLDEAAYRRIITNASKSINKFPSMEAHNKAVKAGTTVNLDYHVALARVSIGACAL